MIYRLRRTIEFCIILGLIMILAGCGQKQEESTTEPVEETAPGYTDEQLLEIYSPVLNMQEYEYFALLDVNQDNIAELFVTDMIFSEEEPLAYWADLYAVDVISEEPVLVYEELTADYNGLSYDSENNWILCNTRIVSEAYPDYYEMVTVDSELEISSDVLELETSEDSAGNITEKKYFNGEDVTEEETEEYKEYLAKEENANEEILTFTRIEKECAAEIVIEWSGTDPETGSLFNLDVEMTGVMEEGSEVVLNEEMTECYTSDGKLVATYDWTDSEDNGVIIIRIYDINGNYAFEGYDGGFDPAEWSNNISYAEATATVTIGEDTYTYDSESGIVRSYTGVWFWGICGIDYGNVIDYDESWIAVGDENVLEEEECYGEDEDATVICVTDIVGDTIKYFDVELTGEWGQAVGDEKTMKADPNIEYYCYEGEASPDYEPDKCSKEEFIACIEECKEFSEGFYVFAYFENEKCIKLYEPYWP